VCNALLFVASTVHAAPVDQKPSKGRAEASCRIIEEAARAHRLPVSVLTRLIWNESRFQVLAVSHAGAQGIAQFMPGTSKERGLANPFDPEQAIPEAAKFIADLGRRFGNVGLAIAAYNAGAGRIASWINKTTALPAETTSFVLAVTGRSANDWATMSQLHPRPEVQSCVALRPLLRDFRIDNRNARRGTMRHEIQSGDVLPAFRDSGRILPSIRESGRILPNMRQSSRIWIGER